MRRLLTALATATVVLVIGGTGCAPSSAPAGPTGTAVAPSPTAPSSTPEPPTPTPTPDPLADLTLEQRVGQLFMVGTTIGSASPETLAAVTDRHVGSIFLHGRSGGGIEATAALVSRFTALVGPDSTGDVPLWVATDQEGGEVQVLRGPGFGDMPYAIRQADAGAAELQANAERWGRALRAAGVTVNLAPVADIVTSHDTRFDNPPVGGLGRQYGYDEETVATKAGAFADGMRDAGVLPTFKHFPGLGRVTQNTDLVAGVVDDTVAADAPDIDVYRALTGAGPSLVMVGLAIYDRIDDTQQAVFSSRIVTGILRQRVGFGGVVVTDDVSSARAVLAVPPAERAIRAIEAGVDLLLVATDPSVLPAMYDAVLAKARTDAAFAARVDESCRRIVEAKRAGA